MFLRTCNFKGSKFKNVWGAHWAYNRFVFCTSLAASMHSEPVQHHLLSSISRKLLHLDNHHLFRIRSLGNQHTQVPRCRSLFRRCGCLPTTDLNQVPRITDGAVQVKIRLSNSKNKNKRLQHRFCWQFTPHVEGIERSRMMSRVA
jgi:hypothetical protein